MNVFFVFFFQVNHVVSFDFPYSLPDYLHRVGRTGRIGTVATKCRATTFMSHRMDVTLAWKIKVHTQNLTYSKFRCTCLFFACAGISVASLKK